MLTGCVQNEDQVSLPFINKPDFTPEWINEGDSAYTKIHQIPAFSLIDQNGKKFTEKNLKGKIYVAGFFFTRCSGICPKLTANMAILQKYFMEDEEVMFLFHSVTPEADSISVLKRYSDAAGINYRKWRLLTGDRDEIYQLARQQYFAGDTIGFYQIGKEFLHTENFILLDRFRRIRGVYNGTLALEMERLREDIEILKKENA
jgi:protein SCO1/2